MGKKLNIFDVMVRGAASQFGREFGRAGANKVLNGSNNYVVQNAKSGRIKPSDSDIIRAIKEINKIKFISTNKGNISRLMDLVSIVTPLMVFEGDKSLMELTDMTELLSLYVTKKDQGHSLIDADFNDKSLILLYEKEAELKRKVDIYNEKEKQFIINQINNIKLKTKRNAILFALFLGFVGGHWAYLKQYKSFALSLFFSFTFIPLCLSVIHILTFLLTKTEKFNYKYNSDYMFYKQFSFNE